MFEIVSVNFRFGELSQSISLAVLWQIHELNNFGLGCDVSKTSPEYLDITVLQKASSRQQPPVPLLDTKFEAVPIPETPKSLDCASIARKIFQVKHIENSQGLGFSY